MRLSSAVIVAAALLQSSQVPQFRAGVDLVHLDVSVLDQNRRPVRGLTAADFVVLEDGRPQAVSTFAAVDYPDAAPPTTPWMRDVAHDTRRNDTLDDRRLFVIVMDDGMAQSDLHAVRSAKDAARKVRTPRRCTSGPRSRFCARSPKPLLHFHNGARH